MARHGVRSDSANDGATLYVLPPSRDAAVPPAPDWLTEAACEVWRELWSGPVSSLWTEDERHAVALLARLTVLVQRGAIQPTLVAQYVSLREKLLLSPRARRLSRVSFEAPEPERAAPSGYMEQRRAELLALASSE